MLVGSAVVMAEGQVVLPDEVLRRFHLEAGDEVEFYVGREGQVFLRPRNAKPELFLSVLQPRRARMSDDDALASAVATREARSRSIPNAAE